MLLYIGFFFLCWAWQHISPTPKKYLTMFSGHFFRAKTPQQKNTDASLKIHGATVKSWKAITTKKRRGRRMCHTGSLSVENLSKKKPKRKGFSSKHIIFWRTMFNFWRGVVGTQPRCWWLMDLDFLTSVVNKSNGILPNKNQPESMSTHGMHAKCFCGGGGHWHEGTGRINYRLEMQYRSLLIHICHPI